MLFLSFQVFRIVSIFVVTVKDWDKCDVWKSGGGVREGDINELIDIKYCYIKREPDRYREMN